MSDDTTHPQATVPSKLPMPWLKMLGIAAVAAMAMFLAGLAFTLSFDALRALAIEINVHPSRAWMAPVAIDVAQAAATAAYVVFRASGTYNYARRFCMGVTVVTVVLSVVGNAYHSWQMAERNIARMMAGEDLGFIPQTPWIAAVIAAIFPLLWLALFHMVMMLLEVVFDDVARHRTAATHAEPRELRFGFEHKASTPRPTSHQTSGIVASRGNSEWHPGAEAVAYPSSEESLEHNGAGTVAVDAEATATVYEATCNGYPQTQDGLLQFLEDSDFHETVKIVASMLVSDPHLKQIDVAQRLKIDKSTVSRRWRQFRDSAEDEGFFVPPLPTSEPCERGRETARA